MEQKKLIGVDLFSGAGGMSLGAMAAGVDVKIAVDLDKQSSVTFKANHPETKFYNQDIRRFKFEEKFIKSKTTKILFGGPPCQGFSTSNQQTRNKENDINWLFKEYLRLTKALLPQWVIVENVKGIVETENGFFFDKIQKDLRKVGYTTTAAILNAADFGVPQVRNRVFIVGSLDGCDFKFPKPQTKEYLSVADAISDLPKLSNGADHHELEYQWDTQNKYQKLMRGKSLKSVNNLVTRNNNEVLRRYPHIPQGGNWEHIPSRLMRNYQDFSRCHTGIYHRLNASMPSVVIGNYRKNMLIHPTEDRGLSVREAARIQSFPDTFHFHGTIGFQQQQVGNSVPPLLAKQIFSKIIKSTF